MQHLNNVLNGRTKSTDALAPHKSSRNRISGNEAEGSNNHKRALAVTA